MSGGMIGKYPLNCSGTLFLRANAIGSFTVFVSYLKFAKKYAEVETLVMLLINGMIHYASNSIEQCIGT